MKQFISQLLILSILIQTNMIAYGQVRADGSTNTNVTNAPNGVTVVNIAGPNSKGLSHNKYTDFNVDQKGLILNNSQDIGRSQLGGIITGNSNLGSQARVILNEVTSSNRSNLNGFMEVHGGAADVIVANPNGISCNGCGFINTPSVTLTTGKPIIEGGELQRLDVNGGKVTVGELGLDASRSDYFDIVSRAVEINGAIHGKDQVSVISGRNIVDYKTKQASAKVDDGSAKPEFGIDSSALGGMYAGAITLIGTEDGVGVKTPENAVAELGNFHVTADGKIVINNALSANELRANSKEVIVSKSAYGKNKVNIRADEVKVEEGALLASKTLIDIESQTIELSNDSNIIANLNESGDLNSTGESKITSSTLDIKGDTIVYGKSELNLNELKFASDMKLTLDEAKINFNSDTTIENGEIDAHTSLEIHSSTNLTNMIKIKSDDLTLKVNTFDNQGQLVSYGNLMAQAEQDFINKGRIEAGDTLSISSDSKVRNEGGLLLARNDVILRANDEIYNGRLSDIISVSRDITLAGLDNDKATNITNDAGNIESVNGDITVKANTFRNLSQGFEKETVTLENKVRIEGHIDRETTYIYYAYDLSGNQITTPFFGTSLPVTSVLTTNRGASYIEGDREYRFFQTSSRELWPHQEFKERTTTEERQKNEHNFVQGSVLASNDIHIEADTFENNLSIIAANNNVNLSGGTLNNISGIYTKYVTTQRRMERRYRTSCGISRCWKSEWYWEAPVVTPSTTFAFSTITAGNTINVGMSAINNGNDSRTEGTSSNIDADPIFADVFAQETDINLNSISGRNNLFRTNPEVTSPFLVETDSEFINLDNFFSSDYFLDQVFDRAGREGEPEELIRRYGDAYVEERLVRDQLFTISGRNLLDGYVDSYSQMQALYDNALDNMDELDLSFGVKLTQDQINRLTKDMVWLETQVVKGVEVLVPKVYLSKLTLENLSLNGSQIVANETNLFSGEIFNTGLIQGRKKLHIDTGNLFNLGGRVTGGDVKLKAANIINRRLTESGSSDDSVYVDVFNPFTGETKTVRKNINTSSYTIAADKAVIEATGNLDIETTGQVQNIGGDIKAGNDLSIKAAEGIISTSVTESNESEHKGGFEEKQSSLTHLKSEISAGGNLSLDGKSIKLIGTDLEAGENIDLVADEDVEIVSVQDESNYYFFQKEKGFLSSKRTTKTKNSVTTQKSELVAGGNIRIASRTKDVLVEAAILKSNGDVNLEAVEGDIKLVSAIDSLFEQTKVDKKNALSFSNEDKGESEKTHQGVQIYADNVNLDAKNVQIDVKDTIDQLANQEGFEYLEKLKDDPRVDWNLVQDEFEQWNEKQTGLSQAASIMIAIAVSIAIGPAGAAASGASAGTVAATAATMTATQTALMAAGNAALTSLATQAATSLVANGGNLGAVFKDLSSSDYLKGLAVATVTAGTIAGAGNIAQFGSDIGGRALEAGSNAAIRSGTESLVYGTSFQDSLESNLKSAAVSFAGELASNEIGSQYKDMKKGGLTALEYTSHKIAHAGLGCALASAQGGSCAGGAIGGAVGEIVGEALVDSVYEDVKNGNLTQEEVLNLDNYINNNKHKIVELSKGAGVIAAGIAGEDLQSAQSAAGNAVEHNAVVTLSVAALFAAVAATGILVTKASQDASKSKVDTGDSDIPLMTKVKLLQMMLQSKVDDTDTEVDENNSSTESVGYKDVTKGKRSIENRELDITREEFEENLKDEGYEELERDEGKKSYEKDNLRYETRDRSTSRGDEPSVDVYKGNKKIKKYRLK